MGLTCKNEVSTLPRQRETTLLTCTKCVSEEAEVMGSGYPRLTLDGSELANKNTTRGELGVRVPPVACWVCPAKPGTQTGLVRASSAPSESSAEHAVARFVRR